MAEPTLSVDYMDLVRVVARQMGYGSTYSTGKVIANESTHTTDANKITLTDGVWPSWAGNAAINIGGTVYGIASRGSDTILTADPITLPDSLKENPSGADDAGRVSKAAGTPYVLVQSITDDKADTFRDIQDVIDQGYHELCFPAPADESYFIWSWLLERADITFGRVSSASNAAVLNAGDGHELPENFGQFIESSITYREGLDHPSVTLISQKEYRGEQARDNSTGVPKYLTWRQKAFTSSTGRRFEALLQPSPGIEFFDTDEHDGTDFKTERKQLEYMYRVIPEQLTPTDRYPLCGAIHSDTLMKACQAVAERKLGDDAGIYEAKFKERLAASIAIDRAVKATMGI